MEKLMFDHGVDNALEIIDNRIEYYDCMIRFDKVDMIEFEIIDELELIREMIKKLKYYD